MHPLLMLLAAVPALAITSLMAWGAVGISRALRERRPVRTGHCAAVIGFLFFLDAALSCALLVSSWASHSEEAMARAPVRCLMLFVALVLLPAGVIAKLGRLGRDAVPQSAVK